MSEQKRALEAMIMRQLQTPTIEDNDIEEIQKTLVCKFVKDNRLTIEALDILPNVVLKEPIKRERPAMQV